MLLYVACLGLAAAAAPLRTHVVLHAPDAARAKLSLGALDHAYTIVTRHGDVGQATRRAAESADAVILYDALHAPLQNTLLWNETIARAGPCAALLPDDIERVGTARLAHGVVLSNGEAFRAIGKTVDAVVRHIRCAVAPMPDEVEEVLPFRAPEKRIRRRLHEHGSGQWFDDYYNDPLRDVSDTPGRSLALLLGYDVTTRIRPHASETISRDEAFCLLAHVPRIAFIGDSLTRFHFFTLNEWLSTGHLQTHLSSKWGNGEHSIHYDTSDRWTHTTSSKHAQHFKKSIPLTPRALQFCGDQLGVSAIETEFWFLSDWHHVQADAVPLFEATVAPWASMVIANSGWWELKACPCEQAYARDASCRSNYRGVLDTYAWSLLDRVPYPFIRGSSCCGEYTEEICAGEADDDRSTWPPELFDIRKHESNKGVLAFNEVLADFAQEKRYPFMDVHSFTNLRNVYDRTIDGSHPVQPLYHLWNQYLLSMVKADSRIFKVEDGVRASDKYSVLSSPLPDYCADHVRGANESDVDCGRACPPCGEGLRCFGDSDCVETCSYDTTPCADATGVHDCRHVAQKPETRCPLVEQGIQAFDQCPRSCGRCTCDTPPTLAPVADTTDDEGDDDAKPAWITDDDVVGYGTSSVVSDIIGDKAIREGGPGSCLVQEDYDDASWRAALKRTRQGMKRIRKQGACALGPGPRVLLLLLFGVLGAAVRSAMVRKRETPQPGIELTSLSRPASPAVRLPSIQEEEAAPLRHALELAGWLCVAAYCDQIAPTGLLPAGTLFLSENPDLWTGIMVLLMLISYAPRLTRKTDDAFFDRSQCNEWKGWMQVAFVSYHYANAQSMYVPIRWFVSAYVWLTGFGNATYFLARDDFSVQRFLKMLWRINFFVVFLSLATGTKWIAYYVVALHTVHFVLCFASFGFSKAALKNEAPGSLLRIVFALTFYLVLTSVLWEFGLYHVIVKPLLLYFFGEGFEEYFWFRTRMDYLSSWFGALAATLMPLTVAGWRSSYQGLVLTVATALFALGAWAWASHSSAMQYRDVAPFVGTLWVPLYAVLRNATPYLRNRVSVPLEWLGARSLELYLLQFHLLMNRSAGRVLWLIPNVNWPITNLIVCALLWLLGASRCFANTASLRNSAEQQPKPIAVALALTAMAYVAMRLVDAPCGAASLGLSVFALVAAALSGYVVNDCARRCAGDVRFRYSASATTDDDECPEPPSIAAEVATPERSRPGLV